jgi:energy-coupling factor transport system ATP-binding protein
MAARNPASRLSAPTPSNARTAGIAVSNLSYVPPAASRPALDGVSFTLAPGEFVAVLGHNGSGKSTLARHLNGLIAPQTGGVTVDELNAARPADLPALRRRVGLIFQNPDHQIVGASVVEDVLWGMGGVRKDEARQTAHEALHAVGLDGYENQATWRLSGGQKQRLALAGVLARGPRYLVCDEPTALLDGRSRLEARDLLLGCRERGLGLLWITHRLDEALLADRLLVLRSGSLVAAGAPRLVLQQRPELHAALPPLTALASLLRDAGVAVEELPHSADDLAEQLIAAAAVAAVEGRS